MPVRPLVALQEIVDGSAAASCAAFSLRSPGLAIPTAFWVGLQTELEDHGFCYGLHCYAPANSPSLAILLMLRAVSAVLAGTFSLTGP